MTSRARRIAAILCMLAAAGCGGDETSPPAPEPEPPEPEPVTPEPEPVTPEPEPVSCDPSGELALAPPNFAYGDGEVVFVDICGVEASLDFDVATQTARVSAKVTFHQPSAGYPMIDLVPAIDALVVDDEELSAASFVTVPDPDGQSEVSFVELSLDAGAHEVELSYLLPLRETLEFGAQDVEFFLDTSDWLPRRYLEKHFPANFAYDRFGLDLRVTIASDVEHLVFANGEVNEAEPNVFDIEFPDTFNSTAPYLHVAPPSVYTVMEDVHPAANGDVALVVYASAERAGVTPEQWEETLGASALAQVKTKLDEMEATFGPYPYPFFIVRLEPAAWLCMTCGMEHAGATVTVLGALQHELAHSWFGRGIFPASGNAEWMDEAIDVWIDWDMPTATSMDEYPGAKLSVFSPYRREVPKKAYVAGPHIMSMLDFHFAADGGLAPILAELYGEYVSEPISTDTFIEFLNARSDEPLDGFFAEKLGGP